ncbi:MAG: enoyl-CoA hydratase-related protein [Chloroflexota bacterium]|jgi:methylglutaconyl-CoA hydratase
MEATVIMEAHHRPGVVTISLNRPNNHNALNRQLVGELTEAFRSVSEREEIRVVILTGKGRSFCAGADLQGLLATSDAGYAAALDDGLGLFDLMTAVSRCPKSVIGRVDGWAVGGGMGLVACCDLVVASERARFGFSEVRLGLIPAVITPFVLSRLHAGDARELYLTGERFDARQARDIGLVDRIAGEGDLEVQVERWIDLLLQGAPGAQAAVKVLLGGIRHRSQDELRHFTSDLFAGRVISQEGREGIQAFIEKRRTAWDESQ